MLTTLTCSALSPGPPTLILPQLYLRVPIMSWNLQTMPPCSSFSFSSKGFSLIPGRHVILSTKLPGCPCPVCYSVWVEGLPNFSQALQSASSFFFPDLFLFFPLNQTLVTCLHLRKLLPGSPPRPKTQGKLASLLKQVKKRDKIHC